jgi:tetratricopeptide (TPR) repeat protein
MDALPVPASRIQRSRLFLALLAFSCPAALLAVEGDFLYPVAQVRSEGMAGQAVALPLGPSSLRENPAGLGLLEGFGAAASYQSLGQTTDGQQDAGTLSLAQPLGEMGGLGLDWDRLSGDDIQQERLGLGWGVKLASGAAPGYGAMGLRLDWLHLSERGAPAVDDQAADLGGGLLWRPWASLSLAAAGDQLATPHLGGQRFSPRWRVSAAMQGATGGWGELRAGLGAELASQDAGESLGVEWSLFKALALRCGYDTASGASAGLGLSLGGMNLDYALRSLSQGACQSLELGYSFPRRPARLPGPPAMEPSLQALPPLPAPRPTPLPRPTALPVFADPLVALLLTQAARYKEQGQAEDSLMALDRALALHPNDEALKALRRSWEAPPEGMEDDEATRLASQAGLNEAQGRPELARELWRAALQLRPGWSEAKAGLARCSRPAAEHKAPAKAQALDAAGMKAYLEGDLGEAVKDWEQALELDPEDPNVLNNLSRARSELQPGGAQP